MNNEDHSSYPIRDRATNSNRDSTSTEQRIKDISTASDAGADNILKAIDVVAKARLYYALERG